MNDLISRQGAINKCRKRLYESAVNNVGNNCNADKVFVDIAENRIETWLNELPSAQPEHKCDKCNFKPFKQFQPERKKGKWIDLNFSDEMWGRAFECSICGEMMIGKPNYCFNCGARMDGEA